MTDYPILAGVFGGTRTWYSLTCNQSNCQVRTAWWLESGILTSNGAGTWCRVYCIGTI